MKQIPGVTERSTGEQFIFLIVQAVIILCLVYAAMLAYQYYYRAKQAKQAKTQPDAFAEVLRPFQKEGVKEVAFETLTPIRAEEALRAYKQECLIINNKKTYQDMVRLAGGELCEECNTIDFTRHSVIGMPIEEVIDGPEVAGGFTVHVFDDTVEQKLTYMIISNAFKQTDASKYTPFADTAHAAYLEPANNWLVKIPKLKEGYTVECKAHTQY